MYHLGFLHVLWLPIVWSFLLQWLTGFFFRKPLLQKQPSCKKRYSPIKQVDVVLLSPHGSTKLITATQILHTLHYLNPPVFLTFCLLNHVHNHSQPMAGCGHAPGLLKLFSKKNVCVCKYVCIFVCLSEPTWENHYVVKAAHIQESLYYAYAQVSFCSKAGFFSELKTEWSDSPQTSNPAFLVVSSVISQLKNTVTGFLGSQIMCISLFWKWVWPIQKLKAAQRLWYKNFQRMVL